MRSFNKMVKEKRTKVLIFVILLLVLNGVHSVDNLRVPDLLHLSKSDGDLNEEVCIAFGEDAHSAIEFSYPIPEDETQLPKTVRTYLPSQLASHNCDFEEGRECNQIWNLQNWTIPKLTSKSYVPISDSRWEDFRTYLINNKTKISDQRMEVVRNADIGLSIRSNDAVDILLCEGFNPKSYPCYTITLGGSTKKDVYITKYGIAEKLSEYKSNFPILSLDEWKNFNIFLSETGQIHLKENNKEISYLNVTDLNPLKTLYLFMNTTSSALWKIHKNHFLFTNISQYVQFGPLLNITSSTLCLSMYLMMCQNCSIYFYRTIDSNKEIIFEKRGFTEDKISHEWTYIRLILENVTSDTIQLFVKTNSNATDRFWAIDNVRVCVKDEIKMIRLSKNDFTKTTDFLKLTFSCHSLNFPEWRPNRQLLSSTPLPILSNTVTSSSIQLHWSPSVQPYIIKYEGSDLCSINTHFRNERRLMSNGWLVIKPKESTTIINNLVPFTYYKITFTDPIYGTNKTIFLSTDPTDLPAENEIPKFIVSPKINEVVIVIPPLQCDVTYGQIFYRFEKIGRSNPRIVIDEPSLTLKNLVPYTNYTLTVQVARSIKKLDDSRARITTYYNFTTKPQVAPSLEFVELYEISDTLASFRYKLPAKANGQPALVGVNICSGITQCNLEMFNITPCNLWKKLYCVTVGNLKKKLNYTFKLSIKNNGTNAFGDERNIISKTEDKVPGAPTNLSYTIGDCSKHIEVCNVNVSWSHPYNQSGVITSFEIFLIDTGVPIMETVLVHNREYQPAYWHTVNYLLYGSTYNVSVRACNLVHKGLAASLEVEIDNIGQHINQAPKLLQMNQKVVTFQLPKLDHRLNSSTIIVVVQQYGNEKLNLPRNLISATNDSLCLQKGTSWIAGSWQMSPNDQTTITIGDNTEMIVGTINAVVINKPLLPKTNYCVNFIIENIFKNTKQVKIYHEDHITLPEPLETSRTNTSIIAIVLVGILILTIVIFAAVFYIRRKQGRRRTLSDGEHIYEAMPNEDYNDTFNVVYNAVYDKLNHD